MDNERLEILFNKYLLRQCTALEVKELVERLGDAQDGDEANVLSRPMKELWEQVGAGGAAYPVNWGRMYVSVTHAEDSLRVIRLQRSGRLRRARYAAAAVLLALSVTVGYLGYRGRPAPELAVQRKQPADVAAPRANRATITLGNGQTIYLDQSATGTLARQGGVQVVKKADGELAYTGTAGSLVYNTLFNPRGSRVINLTLSDGTRVWLNAESSLTYPVAFTGAERRVEITGEAYFEVAHDAAKPFRVHKGPTAIEVLGTRFNVHAYDDAPDLRVTLVQGKLRVRRGHSGLTLAPGQQAVVTGAPGPALQQADVEQVLAWKNGLFQFSNAGIEQVLREAARWYDLELVYEGGRTADRFSGAISREVNVSELLKILEYSKVKFRLEGKRLTVYN